MRRTSIFVLSLALAGNAFAQNGFTVDGFDQFLAKISHSGDREAARQIAEAALSERAGSTDLARWQAELKGEKARRALTAVVDASEFMPPPASAVADAPAPAHAEQVGILDRTMAYVRDTLPRLPNFLAIRTTTHYDITTRKQLDAQIQLQEVYELNNSRPKVEPLGAMYGQELFFMGVWQSVVTYRDGAEVLDLQGASHRREPPLGLETKGEFGPILATVFGDAVHGAIIWSRWERGANGLLAVFHYDVPKSVSHYMVLDEESGSGESPAYHGELAIEPGTGAIYRISLTAAGSESSVSRESDIFLEYGQVEIGGKTYVCPLHGVAYSQANLMDRMGKLLPDAEQDKYGPRYLNDITFTQYHLFRPEVRILTDNPAQ